LNGLLNGLAELEIRYGSLSITDVIETDSTERYPRLHSPTICLRSPEANWEVVLTGLEENSLSDLNSYFACDFSVLVSNAGNYLVIAGNNKAMSIDLNTGNIISESALCQTYCLADLLQIHETSIGNVVVLSAKRVVVFSPIGELKKEMEMQGPIFAVSKIGPNEVTVLWYKVEDSLLLEIEEILSFG